MWFCYDDAVAALVENVFHVHRKIFGDVFQEYIRVQLEKQYSSTLQK